MKAGEAGNTAALSREHTIQISKAGLVTIAGGKWTTYRKMAEDCVNHAATLAGLDERPCVTRDLHIHGYHLSAPPFGAYADYGEDALALAGLVEGRPDLGVVLDPDAPDPGRAGLLGGPPRDGAAPWTTCWRAGRGCCR